MHSGPDCFDDTRGLVTEDDRKLRGCRRLHDREIAVAQPAVVHVHAYQPRTGLGDVEVVDERQR